MISTLCFDSPLGRMQATAEGYALTGLYFIGQQHFPDTAGDWAEDARAQPFATLRRQLDEYFAGRRQAFDLPLAPGGGRGTVFQHAVWDAIAAVPFGATTTYAALAARCRRPAAARAAGAATGRNPISLIIPCHRIVGTSGALTGYAGGLERKRTLLAFERAVAEGDVRPIAGFVAAGGAAPAATTARPAQAVLGLR
ncbi:MAG: methylated-DNA--[protein]-cysteine S-methyltransferase [Betaproteobacteria bacterium]|nr:methylated-DNA--[protein]-cysteine S-methyltransferase [Betaproteobacteria bacterium]